MCLYFYTNTNCPHSSEDGVIFCYLCYLLSVYSLIMSFLIGFTGQEYGTVQGSPRRRPLRWGNYPNEEETNNMTNENVTHSN